MAEIIKRLSLSKQVSDRLEKMIEKGKFKIGQKIPTEVELMELFNVSRNTIREAVQSLASSGILVVKQGDGTYVKSNNRFDATMSNMLNNVNYEEINEARKMLEITIAASASRNRTEEELINIHDRLIKRQELIDDEKENTISDIEFHMEIAKSCHNVVLLNLYKSLYSFLFENIQKRKNKGQFDQGLFDKYHEELYEAIKAKDSDEAVKVTKKILNI